MSNQTGLTSSFDVNLEIYPTGIIPENFVGSLTRDVDHGAGDFVTEDLEETLNLEQQPVLSRSTHIMVLGWNMFGWPWFYEQDAKEAMTALLGYEPTEDDFTLIKNAAAAAYLPEWNFNGIGNFIPGEGYQIKIVNGSPLIGKPMNFPLIDDPTIRNQINSRADLRKELNNFTQTIPAGWSMRTTMRMIPLDALEMFKNVIVPGGSFIRFPDTSPYDPVTNPNGMQDSYFLPGIFRYQPGDQVIYALNSDGSAASTFPENSQNDRYKITDPHDSNIKYIIKIEKDEFHDTQYPNRRLLSIEGNTYTHRAPIFDDATKLAGSITINSKPLLNDGGIGGNSGAPNGTMSVTGIGTDFANDFPLINGIFLAFDIPGTTHRVNTHVYGVSRTDDGQTFKILLPRISSDLVPTDNILYNALFGNVINTNANLTYSKSGGALDSIEASGTSFTTEFVVGSFMRLYGEMSDGSSFVDVEVRAIVSDTKLRFLSVDIIDSSFLITPIVVPSTEIRPKNATEFRVDPGDTAAFFNSYFNVGDTFTYQYPAGIFNDTTVISIESAPAGDMIISKPDIADEHRFSIVPGNNNVHTVYDQETKNGIVSNKTRIFSAIGGTLSAASAEKYFQVGATLAFDIPGLGITPTNVIHTVEGTGTNRIAYWEAQPEVLEHVGANSVGAYDLYTEAHTAINYGTTAFIPPTGYQSQGPLSVDYYYNGKFTTPENSVFGTQAYDDGSILSDVVIAKNNIGQSMLPEYNYNGMGDIAPGEGFQLKLTNAFEGAFPKDTTTEESLLGD